jgi:hypothetical protein
MPQELICNLVLYFVEVMLAGLSNLAMPANHLSASKVPRQRQDSKKGQPLLGRLGQRSKLSNTGPQREPYRPSPTAGPGTRKPKRKRTGKSGPDGRIRLLT